MYISDVYVAHWKQLCILRLTVLCQPFTILLSFSTDSKIQTCVDVSSTSHAEILFNKWLVIKNNTRVGVFVLVPLL